MNDKMTTPDPIQVLDPTVEGGEPMPETLSVEDFKRAQAALKAANISEPRVFIDSEGKVQVECGENEHN